MEKKYIQNLTAFFREGINKGLAKCMNDLYDLADIREGQNSYEFSDGLYSISEQIADENGWFLYEDDN